MDGLTVEHALFKLLRQEHAEILARVEALKDSEPCRQDILWLWEFGELRHHRREEEILFNFLLSNRSVDGGGPLCMIYLDHYILRPPLDRAKALTGAVPQLEAHQIEIFERASAMRIPVNEHRACKELLRYMLENWETLGTSDIKLCLKEYSLLQTENILKEETCFYFMCASLLRPDQASSLLEKFKL